MKKSGILIALILIIAIVSVGIAEGTDPVGIIESIDIDQYTIEELLALQEKIETRIYELRLQDAIENGDRKIEFAENEIVVYNGQMQKLDVTVVPRFETAPKNTKLVLSSSDPGIASVSGGNVKGISAGDATITAAAQDNEFITSSMVVHVRNSVNSLKLAEPNINLLLGDSEEKSKASLTIEILPENAFDRTLKMISSDENVVTVSETGELQAISAGKATITVTTNDESLKQPKVAKCTVNVLQAVQELTVESSLTLNKLKTGKVNPVILPDTASNKKLTYTSSDPSIVTVTQTGALTAKACGSCDIICETTDGSELKAVCHVTVIQMVSSLRLSGTTSLVVNAGSSVKLQASVLPQDATNKKLNWTSSNSNIVKVDNGKITAVNGGDCTITCATTDGSEKKATISVHVPTFSVSATDYTIMSRNSLSIPIEVNGNQRLIISCNSSSFEARLSGDTIRVTPIKPGSGTIKISNANTNKDSVTIRIKVDQAAMYMSDRELIEMAKGYFYLRGGSESGITGTGIDHNGNVSYVSIAIGYSHCYIITVDRRTGLGLGIRKLF